MLSPVDVTPPFSNALRYSSVIVSVLTAMGLLLWVSGRGRGRGWLLHGLGVRRGRRAIGEGDDRAERRACAPVRASRGGGDAVADAVEPGDGAVEVVDHLPVGRRLRPALGVERPARHERGVVGARAGDGPHRRVLAAPRGPPAARSATR